MEPLTTPDDAPPGPAQPLARLQLVLDRLAALRRRSVVDELALADWKFTVAGAEPVALTEGEAWPRTGGPVAFDRHTATVPAEWPLVDVRLELDVGAEADVLLHSYRGRERHRIGRHGPALAAPTRAFGIRIEAGPAPAAAAAERPPSPDGAGPVPRLGATRLVLHAPGTVAALDALATGAAAVAAAWAADATRPDAEARLAALEADLQTLLDGTATPGRAPT